MQDISAEICILAGGHTTYTVYNYMLRTTLYRQPGNCRWLRADIDASEMS